MQSYINVNNLKIIAKHGVLETEKITPQAFIFNIKAKVDFIDAAINDDLSKSVSYCDLMQDVYDYTTSNTFSLIETLAYNVAKLLMLKYTSISQIEVEVKKPNAPYPLDFESTSVLVNLKWNEVYLSLGSNLGNKEQNLSSAISYLAEYEEIQVIKESSILKNAPYGGVATEEFYNMAIKIKTLFSPTKLLETIHDIEYKLGRVRDIHWGNRTIDIDIIFFNDLIYNSENLTIPHVDYANRYFVLKPLSEIAPNYISPISKKTIIQELNLL